MEESSKARATISWEGDSRQVVRGWPKPVRQDFGIALDTMQEGKSPSLAIRPMPSIAAGVFELKDADQSKWYRLVYLSRVDNVIYVLHGFTKNSAKTSRRDLIIAEQRWQQVQQRLREENKREKQKRS